MLHTYIFVAVHAQTLDLVDNFCVIVTLLSARLCNLPPHILEKVLRKTFVLGHFDIRWAVLFVV
jgi:hypothetical protein